MNSENSFIKNRFQQLTECFAYVFKEVLSGAARSITSNSDTDINRSAAELGLTLDELYVLALVFHQQFRFKPFDEDKLAEIFERARGNRGDAYNCISTLKKLGYFVDVNDGPSARIMLSKRAWNAVRSNDIDAIRDFKPRDLIQFLELFRANLLDNDYYSQRDMRDEVDFLFSFCESLTLVTELKRTDFVNKYLICAICARHCLENRPFDIGYMMRFTTAGAGVTAVSYEIEEGFWPPLAKGLVRYAGGNLLREDIELELTPEGIEKFMPELTPELKSKLGKRGLKLPSHAIAPEKIQPVKLLFEDNIKTQIQDLEKLMRPTVFQRYKKSLSPADRMRGLTILLHGDPGSGKTELALQLAKAGNRPVFKLDVTQIKSKWVGESEKNLKNFFSDYNRHLKTGNAEPILLLNECDGLLSRRMSVNSSVDQMTNSLQNLLLENMENFQGILIATTNLTINLDSAFERRFLYKIHFPAPGNSIMAKLWKQHIPSLSKQDAEKIAKNFRFTPGEMLNVARKAALRKMLKPGISLVDTVLQLCTEEKWDSHTKMKLGFQFN